MGRQKKRSNTSVTKDNKALKSKKNENPKSLRGEDSLDSEGVLDVPGPSQEADGEVRLEESFTGQDSVQTSGHDVIMTCLESSDKFLQALTLHQSKNDEFDFDETLHILTTNEQISLWKRLHHYTEESLKSVLDGGAEDTTKDLVLLKGISMICRSCISLPLIQENLPPYLLKTAQLFMKNILPLYNRDGDKQLAESFSKTLELWFLKKMEDRDSVCSTALEYLLLKSTGKECCKTDIKRIWQLHSLLITNRLNETLLLRCVGNPIFLSSKEGIKFQSYLFSISVSFIKDVHRQFKQQLINLDAKSSAAIGEVYYGAWCQSGGGFRTSIEEECIQDFMDCGVKASRVKGKSSVAKQIGKLLGFLHSQKKNTEAQNMISRLYEPILWRHLKVPNYAVRLNACELLMSAYPIEDRSEGIANVTFQLEMQHTAMRKLLTDEYVEIRIAAINGVCHILKNYWLFLPGSVITELMQLLVCELSNDSASHNVRIAVILGMKVILDTYRSHNYLKQVLPRLGKRIHDVNDSVRITLLELLLHVKKIRMVKFWDICPVDDLLARLEIDHPAICRRIIKLLFNSYIPEDGDENVILSRVIEMVTQNRGASRKFFLHLDNLLPFQRCVDLMLSILKCIKKYLAKFEGPRNKENQPRKRKLYNSAVDDDNSPNSTSISSSSIGSSTMLEESAHGEEMGESQAQFQSHPCDNPEVIIGLLDIVSILWKVKSTELAEKDNVEFRMKLESKIEKAVLKLFKCYRESRIGESILYIASMLRQNSVLHISSYCFSQMKKLEQPQFELYVDCLVNWRCGEQIITEIKTWLQPGLDMDGSLTKKTGVRFAEPESNGDDLVNRGIAVMDHILTNPQTRLIVRANNSKSLIDLLESLSPLQNKIEELLSKRDIPLERRDLMLKLFKLSLNTTLILCSDRQEREEHMRKIEDLISWADQQLFPIVNREQEDMSQSSIGLAEDCLAHLLYTLQVLTASGLTNQQLAANILDFVKGLRVMDGKLVSVVLSLLRVMAEFSITTSLVAFYREDIPLQLANILRIFSESAHKLEKDEFNQFKKELTALIRVYHRYQGLDAETSYQDVVELLCEFVLMMMSEHLLEGPLVDLPPLVQHLPTQCEVVVSSISALPSNVKLVYHFILNKMEEAQFKAGQFYGALALLTCVGYKPAKSIKKSAKEGDNQTKSEKVALAGDGAAVLALISDQLVQEIHLSETKDLAEEEEHCSQLRNLQNIVVEYYVCT